MVNQKITDSRGTVKPRGIDALFASYGDETRRMKEEAAAARKRMLSLPNVTEGHEYGKWWLCIVFAPALRKRSLAVCTGATTRRGPKTSPVTTRNAVVSA